MNPKETSVNHFAAVPPGRARRKTLWTVFIFAYLAFVAVRLVFASTAVDRVHNVDRAEYQLVDHARYLTGEGGRFVFWKHHTGHRATAIALIPFLKIAPTETHALKYFAIFVSLIGFASLLYIMLIRFGVAAGICYAFLMIFPDGLFINWSLTVWGAHPEAVSLTALGLAIWMRAEEMDSIRGRAGAGLVFGLVTSYSMSVVFLPPIAFALSFALGGRKRWKEVMLPLFIGYAAGLIPLALYFRGVGGGMISRDIFDTDGAVSVWNTVGFPSIERIRTAWRLIGSWKYYFGPIEALFVAAAVFYVSLTWGRRPEKKIDRLFLFFPLSILFILAAVVSFKYVQFIGVRHFLWVYPAGYFCLAIFLSDLMKGGLKVDPRRIKRAVRIAAVLVCMVLAFKHLVLVSVFIQPDRFGMMNRFRGLEYYHHRFGSVMGEEIEAVNCLLDERLPVENEIEFQSGFASVFPLVGYYYCCRTLPIQPDPAELFYWTSGDNPPKPLYRYGLGCGLALKPSAGWKYVEDALSRYGPEGAAPIEQGFRRCASLPCLNKRPALP